MSETTLEDYQSASLRDLNSHRELMEQLSKTMTAINTLLEATTDADTKVENHNTSATAHDDIRRLIKNAGSVSTEEIDNRINQHDISTTSHSAIRTQLTTLQTEVTNLKPYITQAINQHDSSDTSHAELRATVNALKTQVGELNLDDFAAEIRNDVKAVTDDLNLQLTALSNQLVSLGYRATEHERRLGILDDEMESAAGNISLVAQFVATESEDTDEAKIRLAEVRTEEHNGYNNQLTATSPFNIAHTLPLYTPREKEMGFTITAEGVEGHEISINLEILDGTYTLSKTENIASGEELVLFADINNAYGAILTMKATITDTVNNESIERVFGTMILRPISISGVSLDAPEYAEPGKWYDCKVINLLDINNGRYTYSITASSDKLIFEPSENISVGDYISLHVDESQERGVKVDVVLTVTDSYAKRGGSSSGNTYESEIYINELPTTENFTTTMPDVVVPGSTYNVRFSGIQSAQGNDATFSISNAPSIFTFSQTEGIIANQIITMHVASSAIRGSSNSITLTTHDENDVELNIPLTVLINQLPNTDGLTVSVEGVTTLGGRNITTVIGGGIDPDHITDVVYAIDAADSGLSFSKTSGIIQNEEITITVPKVPSTQVRSFKVYVVDSAGERSPTPKVVSITVEPILLANTPEITSPLEGEIVDNKGFTMAWTPFTYTADLSSGDSNNNS